MPPEHRRRLLDAMSHTVATKGYADTTIADLAAQARVSRRTFYEHFDDKAQCLIALYEAASAQALEVLRLVVEVLVEGAPGDPRLGGQVGNRRVGVTLDRYGVRHRVEQTAAVFKGHDVGIGGQIGT